MFVTTNSKAKTWPFPNPERDFCHFRGWEGRRDRNYCLRWHLHIFKRKATGYFKQGTFHEFVTTNSAILNQNKIFFQTQNKCFLCLNLIRLYELSQQKLKLKLKKLKGATHWCFSDTDTANIALVTGLQTPCPDTNDKCILSCQNKTNKQVGGGPDKANQAQ